MKTVLLPILLLFSWVCLPQNRVFSQSGVIDARGGPAQLHWQNIAPNLCDSFSVEYGRGQERLRRKDYSGAFDHLCSAVLICKDSIRKAWDILPFLFKENDLLKRGAIKAKDSLQNLNLRLVIRNHELDSLHLVSIAQAKTIEQQTIEIYETKIKLLEEQNENKKKMEKLPFGPQQKIFLASEEKGGERIYFYIDAAGNRLNKMGDWYVAEQFDDNGFARVTDDTSNFLLDTFGTKYPLYMTRHDEERPHAKPRSGNRSSSSRKRHHRALGRILAANWNDEDLRNIPHKVKKMCYVRILSLNKNRIKKVRKFVGDLRHLEELYLADNPLKSVPRFLGSDSALTKLELGGTRIARLPVRVCRLPSLKILSLSRNDFKKFPRALTSSNSLLVLDLSHNHIDNIPMEISKLGKSLEVLDLCFNKISELPDGILKLDRLRILGLTGNQFNKFPKVIFGMKNLKVLRIGDNDCSNKERERQKIRDEMHEYLPDCQVYFY
jgi:hypothetical protein